MFWWLPLPGYIINKYLEHRTNCILEFFIMCWKFVLIESPFFVENLLPLILFLSMKWNYDIPLSGGVCFLSAKYSVFVMISTGNILGKNKLQQTHFFNNNEFVIFIAGWLRVIPMMLLQVMQLLPQASCLPLPELVR